MQTKIYTTIDQKLMKAWSKLWETSSYANYTNGPQWFTSVLETFGYKEYAIVTLSEKDKLVGIAALIKGKQFGIPVYAPLPSDFVCGVPFLVDTTNKKQVKTMLTALQTIGTCYFDNIPETFKDTIVKNTAAATITAAAVNHFLYFTYDADGSVLLSNRKKMLRDIRHNPEAFTLKTFSGTKKNGMSIIFNIDKRSRKQGRGYSTFANEDMKKFYLSLSNHFGEQFRINVLYFKKSPIAYELGFLINTTYYGNQIAFDGEYSQYTPGKVLSVKLVDYLHSKKVTKFDFGSGDSHLKRMLTEQNQKLYQIVFSKHAVTRNYLRFIKKTKGSLYESMQKNVKLYKAYKNVIKIIKR